MARRAQRLPPEARRGEILQAALVRFSQAGYHDTTIDDIAEQAGLSKGAVYWHFRGKRELFLGLIDDIVRGLEGQLAAPDPGASGRKRLEHICAIMLGADPGAPGMARLQAEFVAHATRDEELRQRLAGLFTGALQPVVDAVAHGVATGEFREVDPTHAALGMLAALDGLQMYQLLRPDLEVNRIWRDVVELMIRGLEVH